MHFVLLTIAQSAIGVEGVASVATACVGPHSIVTVLFTGGSH